MKLLNKLALATAVAALSTASFAMEAMTDDSMAATTGQDGINLQINTSAAVTADSVLIHDNDGFAGAADAGLAPQAHGLRGGTTSAKTACSSSIREGPCRMIGQA